MSPPAAAPANATRVRRRHVLYLSGFDPQGPAHYHALYAEQAALQAPVNGDRVTVGPRVRDGANGAWDVHCEPADGGAPVHTRYEFLRWDDIVRAHWPRGQWKLLSLTLATTARLVANGALWRILQTSWPAFLALVAPAGLILAVVIAAATLAGAALAAWHASGGVAALLLPALGLPLLFLAARRAQAKVQMAWLMRSAAVIGQQARGELPALEERLDAFAARLLALAASPDTDELLLIGHSSGAMLAVSVMARALKLDPALPERAAVPALLTLGQCIPVLSYQPEAVGFRAELATLRAAARLTWLDFTAPPDGCCFALMDPTEVCLDGQPSSTRPACGPKRLSPRFANAFSPERYRAVRRDKYRCHFQYLMATELPAAYDYLNVTAGPLRLGDRFAAQPGVTGFRDFQCFGGPAR